MKPSSAKAKGRNFQYWVADEIGKLLGIKFDQQDDQCPIHSREMGQSGVDIYFREKSLYEKFPYDIECKNTENISVYSYIKQAEANTKSGRNWLIFHKKNRHSPIVIMDALHFFELMRNREEINGNL